MKISFIISIFNKERFLDRCITSFLDLKLNKSDFEIIFVDDCSTDKSISIVKEYQKKYDFISLYQTKENSGSPAVPRNIGIKKAKGTLISIIDADDWIDGEGFTSLINQMIDNNSDIGFGKSFKHNAKRTYQIARFSSFEITNNLVPYKINQIFRALGPPGKVFKNSLVKENNILFKEFKYGEDKLFFSEIIACAKSASMTNQTIYHVDRYPQNNSLVNQTNIISRVPLNIEIAEEVCKLNIDNLAKKLILERIVEADFFKGLLLRKEFIKSQNQEQLIKYIEYLENLLRNHGFTFEELIKDNVLKNILSLYKNKNIKGMNTYIEFILNSKKKLVVDNRIQLPNLSGVNVPFRNFIDFYSIYNGSLYKEGNNYIAIKLFKDNKTEISKVFLMEKANESHLVEVNFIIENDMLLIDETSLNMKASIFNILIFVNNSDAHLVYASYPYSGLMEMNRQEFKLEFKNPNFKKDNPLKIEDYLENNINTIKTIKEVPVYKDFNFSSENIIEYKKVGSIINCDYIASLPNGGSAIKIESSGFIIAQKRLLKIHDEQSAHNEYIYKIPKSKMLIANREIKLSNNNWFKNNTISEGQTVQVKDISEINNIPYFITKNNKKIKGNKNDLIPYIERDLNNYIIENVSKIETTQTCYLYKDRNFQQKAIKKLTPGTKIKIERIIFNNNSIPRLMTKDGHYLTSNKDFIKILK
ncbi:glycosyltransferase family 2 protein [Staphylococcus pasteuri]|uniref:glycosyltransferase family 2 protein n=1 Tax=Staphylococcus pasteuri TaxID=45972 RepID=UPI00162821F0|nr:glycosyltransferase family 2 protein [Staphylococcus pasteuri]